MDDPELEKLKEKKLQELLKRQEEQKIQVMDLDESNFDKVTSSEKPTLVDFWASCNLAANASRSRFFNNSITASEPTKVFNPSGNSISASRNSASVSNWPTLKSDSPGSITT